MAAPTLQAEGATVAVTTGVPSVTIPTHQADDILVVNTVAWVPNTAILSGAGLTPTPSGWTKISSVAVMDGSDPDTLDGEIAYFWKRATGAGTTVTLSRGAVWDTGADTCYGARAYVIRGCITTGDPWDEADIDTANTAANQAWEAVTVSGSERMVVQFGASTDNAAFAMTSTGWTTGTEDDDATGTDCAFQTARKDNVSSSTTADTATVSAPAQGFYTFLGISFKPPATSVSVTPGTASLTTTRFAPTVLTPRLVTPGTASLVTTLFAPSIAIDRRLTPGIATLTLTAFAPSVLTPVQVIPGIGTLTLTAFTPSVSVGKVVVPGIGTLTLTAFTPTVLTPVSVTPGIGTLTTSRFTPTVTVGIRVTPGIGALSLTGFAPSVLTPRLVIPGIGTLTLTAFTPTVLTPVSVTPGIGSLALTGFAPTVLTPRLVIPGIGVLTTTRFTPIVTIGSPAISVTPGNATLVLVTFEPEVTATAYSQNDLDCIAYWAAYDLLSTEEERIQLQKVFLLEHGARWIKRDGMLVLVGGIYCPRY